MDRTVNDSTPKEMVAEAYLSRLGERGIEYVFANAGTDFAPIVESLSRNAGSQTKFPRFVTVPHENVAMAMAHGYYRTSGKLAAVMVHVTVGTANSICGLMNAARDGDPAAIDQLAALAQDFAIPVVQSEARDFNLPTDHAMHIGYEPGAWLAKADVIVVLDSVVPWIPKTHGPRKDAKVIHISADPLASRYPFREIEADLLIAGD